MATVGLESNSNQSKPLWLLAELTYRCPLQCPYCSNPVEMAKYKNELTTEDWIRVMQQARKMGATQLGFSGGEPLVRKDLEDLIKEARRLGYYTNLITSGVGMDEDRIVAFKEAGLDWYWDEQDYRSLLKKSGGTKRVEDFAEKNNVNVNAFQIRNRKTRFVVYQNHFHLIHM